MANDDPPGIVLPFRRPATPPQLPPRDDVFETILHSVMDHAWRDLAGSAAVFDVLDLGKGLEWADAAIAQGVEGGHETKADLLNLHAYRTLARGDADAAGAEWDALIAAYPANITAHIMRARFHEYRGDDAATAADLDRTVELAPTDPAGYLRRARFYEAKGDGPRALANFRRAVQLEPTSEEALLGLARSLQAAGDPRAATRVYARAAEKELDSAEDYAMRGFMHFLAGQAELALADYEMCVALDPNRPDGLSWRGLCRLRLGRCEGAVSDFTRFIALKPSEPLGYWRRGEALVRLEKHAKALPDLERAIELGPDEQGAAHYARGNAHKGLGNVEAALKSYDVAIERSPSNVAWRLSRFQINNEAEEWERCQVDADAVLALMPDSPPVLLAHARLCRKNKRRGEAGADYDRLIALEPENADAYFERAQWHVGQGNTVEAHADTARAYELKPNDREIRATHGRNKGGFARTDADRAAAIQLITGSAELEPENPEAWAEAGRCFQMIAYHDEATAHYNRALELDPDNPGFLSARAHSVQCQGSAAWPDRDGYRAHLVAAMVDVERAITLTGKDDVELLRHRAGLREDLDDLEGAIADHTKIIEIDPEFMDGYAERARLRKHIGDMPGARADAARVKEMEDATLVELAGVIDVTNFQRFNLDKE